MRKYIVLSWLIFFIGMASLIAYDHYTRPYPKNILYQIEIIRSDYIEVFCSTDAYCYDGTCYWFVNELKQTGIENITIFNLPMDSVCLDGVFDVKDFYKEGRGERYHYEAK